MRTKRSKPSVVFVLGMHRSGTSAVTRGLKVLGLSLGDNLMPPNPEANAKGFFEDLDIYEFNKEILQYVNNDSYHVSMLDEVDLANLRKDGFLIQTSALLRKKVQTDGIAAFKDPRLAKLASFWIETAEHLEYEVNCIVVLRNPLSVVKSLEKLFGFWPEHGYLLWLCYVLESLKSTNGKRRLVVDYDRVMHAPEAELLRIARAFDLEVDAQELQEYCNDFIAGELRHTTYQARDLLLDVACPALAYEVYTEVSQLAADKEAMCDPTFLQKIDRWTKEYKKMSTVLKLVDKQHSRIFDLSQQVYDLNVEMAEMKKVRDAQDERVSELTNVMQRNEELLAGFNRAQNERDAQLSLLMQAVQVRDEQMAQLEQAVQDRDGQVEHLNRRCQELNIQTATLNDMVKQRDERIAEVNLAVKVHGDQNVNVKLELEAAIKRIQGLETSRSWRITGPFRRGHTWVRKGKNGARVVRSYCKEYPFATLLRKVLATLSRQGVRGAKAKLLLKHAQLRHQSSVQVGTNQKVFGETVNRVPSPSYADLMKLDLAGIDILSLDVFDTAIIRLSDTPEGVFEWVEEALDKKGYASARKHAEVLARQQNPHRRDISLDLIYRSLDANADVEVNAELMYCVANPEVFELYRRALSVGKKVLFASDMYLPREVIERILQRAGYNVYEEIFVSSEDDLIKGDGSRFESLKASYPNAKILHVGDNYIADVSKPAEHGIASAYYPSARDFYYTDHLLGCQYEVMAKDASIGIRYLMGAYRYWKHGFKDTTTSFWRDVGFFYAGPLLHAFSDFLNKELAERSNMDGVYFLARDGRIMKAVYETLYGDDDQRLRYLFASRRCMTFPLLSLSDPAQDNKVLDLYSLCEPGTTAQALFDMLGHYELSRLRDDLVALEQQGHHAFNANRVREVIKNHLAEIRLYANKEAEGLLDYLAHEHFSQGKPTLVDVGWSGTIQDSMGALLEARFERKPEISGVYLGVRPNVAGSDRKKGFLFDNDAPELAEKVLHHYADFIELLTATDEDGIQRVENVRGQFVACYQQCTQGEETRKRVSRQIQMGAQEYASLVKSWDDKKVPVLTPQDIVRLFDALKSCASASVVAEFDAVKHARMLGGPHSHNIIYFDQGL